jgi:PhnB protein
MSAKAIPEGHHTLRPLCASRVRPARFEFYKKAFDATELMRLAQPDGRIGHSEIRVGDSVIMLSDEFPEVGAISPQATGGSPVTIHLYVEDVDTFSSKRSPLAKR